jgi:23S rRNA (uracil1939-C5)-methyltransferase
MSFAVGPGAAGPVVGLRESRRFDAIVDLRTCLLVSEAGEALLHGFRDFVARRGLEPYDLRAERGELRYLVLREGRNTGRRLALVVARTGAFPFDDFAALAERAGFTGAALALNPARSDVAGGEVVRFAGLPLEERIGGTIFEISPASFFQPSTGLAERLVELAGALLGADSRAAARATLLDLYCGVGLFALTLRERFARAIGIESAPGSARDAARNVVRNGASNVEIVEGEVEAVLPTIAAAPPGGAALRAIVDPPRAGLRPAAVRAILASPIETLVYVSCNPTSMARDIAALDRGFRLDGPVHVVDSLPWTPHVEAVARLVRAARG